MAREWIGEVLAKFHTGEIDRREFVKRAGALGLSATLIGQAMNAHGVAAQDATPASEGGAVGMAGITHITDTSKGTIKFYSSWPMIADSAQLGADMREGVTMAVEDFGAAAI